MIAPEILLPCQSINLEYCIQLLILKKRKKFLSDRFITQLLLSPAYMLSVWENGFIHLWVKYTAHTTSYTYKKVFHNYQRPPCFPYWWKTESVLFSFHFTDSSRLEETSKNHLVRPLVSYLTENCWKTAIATEFHSWKIFKKMLQL